VSRTVDNVIVLQTSAHRQEVVNRASFYVGTSRTRRELYLVVDNYEGVAESLGRQYRKTAALDIVPDKNPRWGQFLALGLEPGKEAEV
jgi:hypothetical protein